MCFLFSVCIGEVTVYDLQNALLIIWATPETPDVERGYDFSSLTHTARLLGAGLDRAQLPRSSAPTVAQRDVEAQEIWGESLCGWIH